MATTTLGNKAVGSIIQLKENGKLVSFYVAKHNYENALNGMGRTLVVRKDCYDTRAWHSSNVNAYASSAIDSWLNSTYKNLLDADIRGVIGTTKIKYTPGNGNNTVGTLQRAIFLLSPDRLQERLRRCSVGPLPEHGRHLLRRLLAHLWRCRQQLLHQHRRVPPRFHSPLHPLCER